MAEGAGSPRDMSGELGLVIAQPSASKRHRIPTQVTVLMDRITLPGNPKAASSIASCSFLTGGALKSNLDSKVGSRRNRASLRTPKYCGSRSGMGDADKSELDADDLSFKEAFSSAAFRAASSAASAAAFASFINLSASERLESGSEALFMETKIRREGFPDLADFGSRELEIDEIDEENASTEVIVQIKLSSNNKTLMNVMFDRLFR